MVVGGGRGRHHNGGLLSHTDALLLLSGLKHITAPRKAQLLSKRGGLRTSAAMSGHPYLPKPGGALR